jgi:predicted ATPase/DNA-binding SARP family transcriptional activator/tetratricopeptide (TPR) repeat protein
MSTTQLTMQLLGANRIDADSQPLTFESQAARALLIYLIAERDRVHRRETLAGFLSPDKTQDAANTNLRQTLARLKRVLPKTAAAAVVATQQTLQFNLATAQDAMQVDLIEFETHLKAASEHSNAHVGVRLCDACVQHLRRTIELYRGEFLQGISLKLSEPYQDWMLTRRESLHQQAMSAAHTLALHHESSGEFVQMHDFAVRQIALDPLRETAYAQSMRALAHMGDRARALAQYDACQDVLARELGIEPGDELRTLHKRIAAGELMPTSLNASPPRHALPEQLTPFIGRHDELADIAQRLRDPHCRLLTLAGPGGMGKTRLAIEAARARLVDYPDGVFFVALASLTSPGDIAPAVCAGIGLPTQNADTRDTLLNFLAGKKMLLILDNFEHLMSGVDIALDVVRAAPALQIIVTSRERLNVLGETVLSIGGMGYAPNVEGMEGDVDSPATQLFAQSARRVRADFALTPTNTASVLRICQLVGGMPLGLELAAAWCEAMPVNEIADEIERSADFLTADWRDMPERQRSLRAVFDWSWQLLTEAERRVLCGLAVFHGAFTRSATHAVADATAPLLATLMRKSLLRRNDAINANNATNSSGHYELHELIRQFAEDKLRANPANAERIAKRHSEYFLNGMARMEAMMYGRDSKDALAHIQSELANVREAWSYALTHHNLDGLNKSTFALAAFFSYTNLVEGQHNFEQAAHALRAYPESDEVRLVLAKVLASLVAFHFPQGDFQAAENTAQEAIALARLCDDPLIEAIALVHWADALSRTTAFDAARERALQALALVKQPRDTAELPRPQQLLWPMLHLSSLFRLSKSHEMEWQFDRALEYAEEALRVCEALDSPRYQAIALDRLGEILRRQGQYESSLHRRLQALDVIRQSGDLETEIAILNNLGDVYFCLGQFTQAISTLERGIQLCHAIGSRWMASSMQETLVYVYLNLNQPEQALACAKRAEHMIRGYYLNSLGLAYEQLGRSDEAVSTLLEAVAWWQRQVPNAAIAEAYAGLARVSLARGENAQATDWATQALPYLGPPLLADGMNPLQVYWSCAQVLRAQGDPRASAILKDARALLASLAAGINDRGLRRSFLAKPVHREIAQARAYPTAKQAVY